MLRTNKGLVPTQWLGWQSSSKSRWLGVFGAWCLSMGDSGVQGRRVPRSVLAVSGVRLRTALLVASITQMVAWRRLSRQRGSTRRYEWCESTNAVSFSRRYRLGVYDSWQALCASAIVASKDTICCNMIIKPSILDVLYKQCERPKMGKTSGKLTHLKFTVASSRAS